MTIFFFNNPWHFFFLFFFSTGKFETPCTKLTTKVFRWKKYYYFLKKTRDIVFFFVTFFSTGKFETPCKKWTTKVFLKKNDIILLNNPWLFFCNFFLHGLIINSLCGITKHDVLAHINTSNFWTNPWFFFNFCPRYRVPISFVN